MRPAVAVAGAAHSIIPVRGAEAAMVLVTHNAAIAPMADRVLHLRDGRIEDEARNQRPTPPAELSW